MCAWFNEWHRFGERDQLSFSYVLLVMGYTPELLTRERAEKKADTAGSRGTLGSRAQGSRAKRLDAVDGEQLSSLASPMRALPPRAVSLSAAEPRLDALPAHSGVYLWPRSEHWRAKRQSGEPKKWRYVHYAGHGGPGTE